MKDLAIDILVHRVYSISAKLEHNKLSESALELFVMAMELKGWSKYLPDVNYDHFVKVYSNLYNYYLSSYSEQYESPPRHF